MRIVFANPVAFPTTRAYGVQLAKTADELLALGHEVEFWIPAHEAPFPAGADEASLCRYYGVRRLPKIRRFALSLTPHGSLGWSVLNQANYFLLTWSFARAVRSALCAEKGIDAVITRDPMLARICGNATALFWEMHTLPAGWRTALALDRAFGIIPISGHLRDVACKKHGFPTQASLVLASGVDLRTYQTAPSRDEARRTLGLDPSLTLYAFAGRFQETWKGRDTLLEMVPRLNDQERLYLIGDMGGAVEAFRATARERGVDLKNVIFAGQVSPQDVPIHLSAADAVLVPNSGKEPIGREHTSPLKLFEALALGRPVVASDVPAIREVVSQEQVWLFAADDAEACLTACREVTAQATEAERRTVNAHALVAGFGWDVRAKRLAEFLQERLSIKHTVIVPIFDGAISKNIVDSGALETLRSAGYRVLLWVYESKAEYYRQRYGTKGYVIAEYGEPRIPLWATHLQNFAIDCIPTRALYIKHRKRIVQKKKYVLGAIRISLWALGHLSPIRWVIQRLPLLWPVPLKVRALVRTERPALVFCPTMVWLAEVQLVRHVQRLGLPTVGMCKSWDNITSKLMLPIKPDHLIVPTERCVDEAERFLAYPRSRVTVVGLAQFDRYHEPNLLESREVFCRRMKLDPNVPILLFCAAGLWMAPDEPEIIRQLDADIERGVFGGPMQILVRLHPKYDCGADRLADLKHTMLDRPGTYITKEMTQWEYEDGDLRHILSSIRHASVTVNTASTMSIEAAYFDRPVINVGFDPKPVPYWMSVMRYYEREHYAPIIEAGGAKLSKSYDELVRHVQEYLKDPSLDHDGRERVIREQCVDRDPVAAKRIGDVLLRALRR